MAGLVMLLLGTGETLAGQATIPAIPDARGTFALQVRYPRAGSVLAIGDSTFLIGNVGDGRATLTIDGATIPVAPNGAWLAWVAIPRDSAVSLRLEARLGERVLRATFPLVRAEWARRTGAWFIPGSLQPTGQLWLPRGEPLTLTVLAAPGASIVLQLAGGEQIPFGPTPSRPLLPAGSLAFERDERAWPERDGAVEYAAVVRTATVAGGSDWLTDPRAPSHTPPTLIIALGGDTTRVPWPIAVMRDRVEPRTVTLDDMLPRGGSDGIVIGRNRVGGSYHWFFPNGTTTTAEARHDALARLRLGDGSIAWVPLAELRPRPGPEELAPAVMGSLTLTPTAFGLRLRIPLTRVVPHQVVARPRGLTITLLDAVGDADWSRWPTATSFLAELGWRQVTARRVELDLAFDRPLWGWRVSADPFGLVFEFRQPPMVDAGAPLRGRAIILDAGHPPLGACGPTGLCEPEVTLAVAQIAAELLRAEGARVTLTRESAAPMELAARVARADSLDAEVLVSIHLNALPDGINPFTNNGTSTFFQHPQAVDLASEVQSRLVAAFGLRDLGIAQGDLAMVRPTWYPSILTEGLFLMVPAQEAAMRTVEGRTRYAEALVAGLRSFLARTAVSTGGPPDRPQDDSPLDHPEWQ
jgi:N-acetylmuramoyl-L-alanine amidase